jgi:G3E family GTPase
MAVSAAGDRIPISLVTGFLGSGKTTLIAALLKQPAMRGTAVVVNEFGAVGIDNAVFAESLDATNVRLLANGCLCCTGGDDLAATLWSLIRREDPPRRIVIETTGLAEPAPVLARLMSDPRLAATTRLDTVVATVDAVSGLKNIEERPVASRQCAVADRRLITKADLVDAAAVEALGERLRMLNPGGAIHVVQHGRIAAEQLFGASLFNAAGGGADLDRWLSLEAHRAVSKHRGHARDVSTWLVEEESPMDWTRLSPQLGEVVRRHGDFLLRLKGVLHTAGDPRPLVIHGVRRVFHPPVRLQRWASEPRSSIVLIGDEGAHETVDAIRQALAESAVATSASVPRASAAA